jgi:hypothetical protein
MTVTVYFDYTCGFSDRARRWLDHLHDVDVTWRPFSLLELHRADDGPTVFQQHDLVDNVSLIALAVHEAVGADGGDAYRRRMFTAWHDEPGRLSTEDIVGFGRDAGLRGFDRDAAFAALAADHADAAERGVFGTPTLVYEGGQAAFVKLDAVPDADRARPLWDTVSQLATADPALREWQRVTAPPSATGF